MTTSLSTIEEKDKEIESLRAQNERFAVQNERLCELLGKYHDKLFPHRAEERQMIKKGYKVSPFK